MERPNDRFFNTTVEALPVNVATSNATNNGYVVVGEFDSNGLAEGQVRLGLVKALRLRVHSDSDNWVILSEVSCDPRTEG